jgi:hypothetical protein
MASALVQAMEYQLPGNLFDRLPAAFITYLLGSETAEKLGIHDEVIAGGLSKPLSIFGTVLSDLNRHVVLAEAATKFSSILINSAVFVERGGNRPAFSIPVELQQTWGINWLH